MKCGKCGEYVEGARREERGYIFGFIPFLTLVEDDREGISCGRKGCFRWLCPDCARGALCTVCEDELRELPL